MESNITLANKEIRDKILYFEDNIGSLPDSFKGDTINCPLKHSFADGMYVREIFIPKGMILCGKIHKHDHPNFLLKGEVEVFTESNGLEKLVAPMSIISKAGTKRIVNALQDTVWVTVHANPNNLKDVDKIEDIVIAKTYEEFDKFSKRKFSIFSRFIRFVKNKIKPIK